MSDSPSRATGLGCTVAGLLTCITGYGLLWLSFSGAPTQRGNPVLGLVFGAVALVVGLAVVVAGVMQLLRPDD